LFYGIGQNSALKEQRDHLEKDIELLEQKEDLHWDKLDGLKSTNKTIIQKEKTLIQIEHDTIKVIDSIPFSELQKYFTDRYHQEDSIE
jgi:hypothetical protein